MRFCFCCASSFHSGSAAAGAPPPPVADVVDAAGVRVGGEKARNDADLPTGFDAGESDDAGRFTLAAPPPLP